MRRHHSLLASLLTLLLSSTAAAQTTSAAASEVGITGGTLTLISYLILWGLIFAFLAAILSRQRKLDADLAELKQRIDDLQDH